jgi:hypothetical protein
MKLYKVYCWNKGGYPIGPVLVVASNKNEAKATIRKKDGAWVGKMTVHNEHAYFAD